MGIYGRAAVSKSLPRAHAICDRCGFRFNHDALQFQYDWRGPRLQNLRVLVCKSCLDRPQERLRTLILPPDTVPVTEPRPEAYDLANNARLTTLPSADKGVSLNVNSSNAVVGIGTLAAGGPGNAAIGGAPSVYPTLAGANLGTLATGGGVDAAF